MLCYVMLCYVMLCYVMLCYVMLCYVMFSVSALRWFCKQEISFPTCLHAKGRVRFTGTCPFIAGVPNCTAQSCHAN